MATMKAILCRDHGGQFLIPSRRGRPPVRCSEDNRCDMTQAAHKNRPSTNGGRRPNKAASASSSRKKTDAELLRQNRARFMKDAEAEFSAAEQVEETKAAAKKPRNTLNGVSKSALRSSKWCDCKEEGGDRHERGIEGCKFATRDLPVTVKHNPSIPLAMHAREQLEPLGWSLTGKAWIEEDGPNYMAEVVGTRGDETIILRWKNGKRESQQYIIWDSEKVSTNGKPKSRLPFDPDTLSDVELANELRGRKVTWWNRLAKGKETAIVGEKFQIQHNYDEGHEHARMVLFIDKSGAGFRAFHVEALMKVD